MATADSDLFTADTVNVDASGFTVTFNLVAANLAAATNPDPVWVSHDQYLVTVDSTASVTSDTVGVLQHQTLVPAVFEPQIVIGGVTIASEHTLEMVNMAAQAAVTDALLEQQHLLVGADATSSTSAGGVLLSQEHELGVEGLTSGVVWATLELVQNHTLSVDGPVSASLVDPVLMEMVHLMWPGTIDVVTLTDGPLPITQQHLLTIPESSSCTQITVPPPIPEDDSTIIGGDPTNTLEGGGVTTLASSGGTSLLGSGGTSLLGSGSDSILSSGVVCPDVPEVVDPEEEVAYAKRVDFINDNLLYRGEADPGTTDSQLKWRVRRITIGADNDVTEEWANGSAAYVHAWSERLTYGYS